MSTGAPTRFTSRSGLSRRRTQKPFRFATLLEQLKLVRSQAMSSPPGHMLPWSHWSRPHGPDERVQRITQNVLKRALGGD